MWQKNLKVMAILMLSLAGLTGCSAGPGEQSRAFPITVTVDDSLVKTQQVEVNIIAVPETEKTRWDSISVDDYWQPDSPLRKSADLIKMQFNDNRPFQTVAVDDPQWAAWKAQRSMWLFVVAYIPGVKGAGPGEADPRRQEISIDAYTWRKSDAKELKFQVDSSGIRCLTQPPGD